MVPNEENQHIADARRKACLYTHTCVSKRFDKYGWQTLTFCHKKRESAVAKLNSDRLYWPCLYAMTDCQAHMYYVGPCHQCPEKLWFKSIQWDYFSWFYFLCSCSPGGQHTVRSPALRPASSGRQRGTQTLHHCHAKHESWRHHQDQHRNTKNARWDWNIHIIETYQF